MTVKQRRPEACVLSSAKYGSVRFFCGTAEIRVPARRTHLNRAMTPSRGRARGGGWSSTRPRPVRRARVDGSCGQRSRVIRVRSATRELSEPRSQRAPHTSLSASAKRLWHFAPVDLSLLNRLRCSTRRTSAADLLSGATQHADTRGTRLRSDRPKFVFLSVFFPS